MASPPSRRARTTACSATTGSATCLRRPVADRQDRAQQSVSYVGAFDLLRKRFAAAELSKERGYTAGTFSFNAGDGRCPTCGGNGFEHVEMQFLSDVYLRCPDCDGKRFRAEVLEVTVTGRDGRARSVADVLDLTVHEALAVFAGEHDIRARLQPLADVGLDYLRLGQPVPTLSGGEAQRLKLAGFLAEAASQGLTQATAAGHAFAKAGRRGTLFMLDEPTTGLHFDDVAKLLRAFRKLLDAGHSLLVIEHNLDVIRASDWLIDLGPEGGDAGGRVVATGTPAQLASEAHAHGKALAQYATALRPDAHHTRRRLAGRAVRPSEYRGATEPARPARPRSEQPR